MSKDRGYIKVYRDICLHELWKDKPFSRGQAWVDLILMANHEDKSILFDGCMMQVHKGEIVTSLRKLSDRWGWSINKVGRFLNALEKESMLIQKRNSKRTTVRIVNYCIYQDARNTENNSNGTQTEHRRNTDGNKQDTNECTKEEKAAAAADSSVQEKGKEVRHKYGEYKHVLLTDKQYARLIADFGEALTSAAIQKVDVYCEKSGKTYKNYNLVIRDWGIKEKAQAQQDDGMLDGIL